MLSILHRVARYLLAPLCVMTWLACLLRHWRAIRRADVIVQADRPRAFGATLNAIEIVRRLYPGKNIVILVFREPQNHNPRLGLIFGKEITFVSWPRPCLRLEIFGRRVILPPRPLHDAIACRVSELWFRCFARRDVVLLNQPTLYGSMPKEKWALAELPRDEGSGEAIINGYTIDGLLSRYFNSVSAPPVKLPEPIRGDIARRVTAALGGRPAPRKGWCGMHLKEDETGDAYKDGSPLQDYLPAITKIVEAGYQVLLKGDRRMPRDVIASFEGMVVDGEWLGVDEDLFNLFVITDSTIFVGDSGPGTWMTGAMDYPVLALNVFPIGLGFSVTWVYFKSCYDETGRRVPPDALLSNLNAVGSHPEGWTEKPMTERQITEAVEDFLAQPVPRPGLDDHPEIVELMPKWSCFRMVGVARLAPSWVRANFPESLDRNAARKAELAS